MLTMLLRICFDSQPQLNLAAKRQRCWPLCQSICLKWYSRPSVIWPGGHDRCCSCDQDAKEFCFEKCSPCSKGVHKPDRVSNIDCNWNLWPRPRKENETLKSLETNDTIIHNHHYIYIYTHRIHSLRPWGQRGGGESSLGKERCVLRGYAARPFECHCLSWNKLPFDAADTLTAAHHDILARMHHNHSTTLPLTS